MESSVSAFCIKKETFTSYETIVIKMVKIVNVPIVKILDYTVF